MVNYSILFVGIFGYLSGMNILKLLLSNVLYSFISSGNVKTDCQGYNGRIVTEGMHYIPGPDTCTLCVCDNSVAKWCKAVLCSPPQVNNLYSI